MCGESDTGWTNGVSTVMSSNEAADDTQLPVEAGAGAGADARADAAPSIPDAGADARADAAPSISSDTSNTTLGRALQRCTEPGPKRFLAALGDEIEHESDEKRLALWHHERGHLLERYLADDGGAARAYAEALSLDPGLRPNLWAIRRTLVGHGRWENLLKLFDAELRVEQQDERRRAEVLLEKGWVLEDRFGRHEEAVECLWQAHELTRSGWLVPLLSLERIACAAQDRQLLARTYRAMVEVVDDPERRASVLRDLARLQEQDDGPDAALATLDQALSLCLDRTQVLLQMEAIAARAGANERRVELLRALASESSQGELGDPDQSAALLLEAAWIARSELRSPDLTRELLQQALALAPHERSLRFELQLLAETSQDSVLLAEVLREKLAVSSDLPQQTALWFELSLAYLRGDETPRAAEALGRCLELTPGYLPALVELERAAMAEPEPRKLIDIWLAELGDDPNASANPSYCAHVLWRAALVELVALGRLEHSVQLCQRALELSPDYAPALELRLELLRRSERYEELVDALLEAAGRVTDTDEAERFLLEAASVALGPLQDSTRAIRALQQLSDRPDVSRYALYRLAELLEQQQAFEQLDSLLIRLEAREAEPRAKRDLRLRRASVALRQGNDELARTIYQQEVAEDPTEPYALSSLITLLRRTERVERLAQTLATAAEHCTDAEQQREYLLELAQLYLGPLNDPQRSVEIYRQLIEQGDEPFDAHLHHQLELAARAAEQPEVVIQALRGQLARATSEQTSTALRLLLAEQSEDLGVPVEEVLPLYEEVAAASANGSTARDLATAGAARQYVRLGELRRAYQCYVGLSELDDKSPSTWLTEECAWLAAVNGDSDALSADVAPDVTRRRALLQLALAGGDDGDVTAERFAEANRALAKHLSDSPLLSALELQQASLLEGTAGAKEHLADLARQTLQREDGNLEALLLLLRSGRLNNEDRADLLRRLSERLSARFAEQVPLLLAHAEQVAGHAAKAARLLKQLLASDPNHLPALLILQRTAASAGHAELEGRTWLRIAGLFRDNEARAMAYGRAGALFETLGEAKSARCAYRRALAAKPGDQELLGRLEETSRDAHDDRGLEEVISLRLRQTDDPSRRSALLFERAELRAERLDNPRGAASDLLRVLAELPNDPSALKRLGALFAAHADLERAIAIYRQLQETAPTSELQLEALLELAHLLVRQGDLEQAANVCRRYLESYPQEEQAWECLVEVYLAGAQKQHARDALARLSQLPATPERRAARLRRLARFYWRELSSAREARDTLLAALEADAIDMDVLGDLRRVCKQLGVPGDFQQPVERAKSELRQLLGRSPLEVPLYERLSRLAEWSEDQHTLLGTLGVLCCFNAAQPAEREIYQRRMLRVAFDPRGPIPPHIWRDSLVAAAARGALSEVWRVIVEAVPRLYRGRIPTDVSAYGSGRDDRVQIDAASAVGRIAQVLGVGDFELYVTRRDPRIVAPLLGDPPALVIGYELLSTQSAADRFRLGRALYLLKGGLVPLETLSREELKRLFSSAIYGVSPAAIQGQTIPQLDDHSRVLHRTL
jgi:tetratricopeptide (TPR) repeat protein